MREVLKRGAFWMATLAALPSLVSFAVRRMMLGGDRALEGTTESLSLLPGTAGDYVRRAFLARALAHCHRSATVKFGTLFSQTGARISDNVYIGPRCHIGLAHIERDVLIGAGVHIPSGGATHGTADLDTPIRAQEGRREVVRIGAGAWIGSGAIVMANVGRDTIVGAGAVVTKPLPDGVVAAGVPARVIRFRNAAHEIRSAAK
jgi:acetyltransferase-like isoleucine patch superfamily enzyme